MANTKQVRSRNRSARLFLAKEFQLAKHYKLELEDGRLMLPPEDRAYKCRVVSAVNRTIDCLDDEKKRFAKVVFVEGNRNVEAVCHEFSIAQTTYYYWRTSILKTFGLFVGVV